MATQTPVTPAPASATGGAKPISAAELQRELTPRAPERQEAPPPSRERQQFREENPSNVTLGDDKGNRSIENPLPGFREKARQMQEDKAREQANEPEVKKPAKKEPVASKDDAAPAKVEAVKDEEVPAEQRQVLPTDKPDTAKRIKFFLSENKRLAQEAETVKKELETARKAPASPDKSEEVEKLRQEYQKTQDELLRFRRRYDIDNDPEFKGKYREPVVQIEKAIEDTLKKHGFGEATLKAISDEGGFAGFSRSNRTFTVQEPGEDGQTRPVQRTAAELARAWLTGLPVGDSEAIKASLGKQQLLKSEESAAITKAQDEAKSYFEAQSKSSREAHEAANQNQKKMAEEFETWSKKVESETDWMKDTPIPENATDAQKKDIEDRNEFAAQLRAGLKKHPANAQEYGQLKLEAAESHHLRRANGALQAELDALKMKLDKAKSATRTTPKSGSLMTGPRTAPSKPDDNRDPTDFRSAFREKAMKMSSGQSLDADE